MSDDQALTRPIGWWLKEADAQIDAAFDGTLQGTGVDRRGWQVLASLSKSPMRRAELVASLASFDPSSVVEQVLDHLRSQGWVEQSSGRLQLTEAGVRQQESLAPLIDGVRQRIAAALPQEEYAALVGLLARLVAALRPPT